MGNIMELIDCDTYSMQRDEGIWDEGREDEGSCETGG